MLTRFKNLAYFSYLATLLGSLPPAYAAEELPALTVMGQETANQRPVTTFETPLSNLDFDPRVDFQSRNMAEAQGDISIRGGTFENTGVQVGSATLLDPQTGHYTTELPIAPEMLSEPKILTGADNALRGFNSNTGTVSYSWSKITPGGSLTIGGGDHNLNFQRIHHALTGSYGNSKDWTWGAEIEGARSESDGTIPYGDHAFDRTSGRIQLLGPDSQTDLFAGYQDKFYGWPGMYSAKTTRLETEDYQLRLFSLNHFKSYSEESHFELTTFHRQLTDRYFNKRNDPSFYEAWHRTEAYGVGVTGRHQLNPKLFLNHASQISSDKLVYTDATYNGTPLGGLDKGKFTRRNYYRFSLVPEYQFELLPNEKLTIKGGATWDDTNRNSSKVSPIFRVSKIKNLGKGSITETYLDYSETSQVVGYSAIGGSTSGGLFNSNKHLDREISKTAEIGHFINTNDWKIDSSIFYRWDEDLTDWTYTKASTDSRTANPVDIDTFGFEIVASRTWNKLQAIASYAYLKKNEDYEADVDGSFYALNYPEHRATLGLIWDPIDTVQIRVDNEWREQRENIIRTQTGAPNKSTFSHLAASYFPQKFEDLELFLAYDKPWEKDFQDIPGIAPRGDQFSFGATYSW
jgi:hypothetical protein